MGIRKRKLTLIKGIPIYFNNSLHSSLCCLETFTNLLLNFSMFSSSPIEIEIEHYLNFRKKSMMLFRLYQKLNHKKSQKINIRFIFQKLEINLMTIYRRLYKLWHYIHLPASSAFSNCFWASSRLSFLFASWRRTMQCYKLVLYSLITISLNSKCQKEIINYNSNYNTKQIAIHLDMKFIYQGKFFFLKTDIVMTHLAWFHVWWFTIEHIYWFNTILYHSNGSVKHSHQVTEIQKAWFCLWI